MVIKTKERFTISGDQLVKGLKGSGSTSTEKIELAEKVQLDYGCTTLPNPLEFLLDWCIQLMVRSTKYHTVSVGDTPYLNPRFWNLLKGLVGELILKHEGVAPRHHVLTTLFSKYNLVQVMVKLIQSIKAGLEEGLNLEIYLHLLISLDTGFNLWFNYLGSVGLDWQVKFLLASLETLDSIHSLNTNEPKNEFREYLMPIRSLTRQLVSDMNKTIKWTSTYKKLYQVFVDQLLLPIISTKFNLIQCNSIECINLTDDDITMELNELIKVGLFSPDYILDYGTIFTTDNTQSYRRNLFDTLSKALKQNKLINPILDFLPSLLAFLIEQNPTRPAIVLEFGLFTELVQLINSQSNLPIIEKMSCMSKLLGLVNEHDLFKVGTDTYCLRQRKLLDEIRDSYISLDHTNTSLLPSLLSGYKALLEIDYSLIDSQLVKVWQLCLCSSNGVSELAGKLAIAIFEQYGKARQWSTSFMSMVTAMSTQPQSNLLLLDLHFSKDLAQFLKKMTSVTQNQQLIINIAEEVIAHINPAQSDGERSPKKIKLGSNLEGKIMAGPLVLLAQLVRGIPKSALPFQSIQPTLTTLIQCLINFHFPAIFESSTIPNLLSQLSNNITKTIAHPDESSTKFATLYLVANLQDHSTQHLFVAPHLSNLLSHYQQAIPFDELIQLVRTVLQTLDFITHPNLDAIVKATDQDISHLIGSEELKIQVLEAGVTLVWSLLVNDQFGEENQQDMIFSTLLGPWFPLLVDIATTSQLEDLSIILANQPTLTLTLLNSSQFYELPKLKLPFTTQLFTKLSQLLTPNKTSSLNPIFTDDVQFQKIQPAILDTYQTQLSQLDEIDFLTQINTLLGLFTKLHASYLDKPMHGKLFKFVYAYHHLLSLIPTTNASILEKMAEGWYLSLTLIIVLLCPGGKGSALVRFDRLYLSSLVNTITQQISKFNLEISDILKELLDKVVKIGLKQYLSILPKTNDKEEELIQNLTSDLINKNVADSIKRDVVVSGLRGVITGPNAVTKLQSLTEVTIFQATTLKDLWSRISKLINEKGLEEALRLNLVHDIGRKACKDYDLPSNHSSTLLSLIALSNQYLPTQPFLYHQALSLPDLYLCDLPDHFLPNSSVLPLVTLTLTLLLTEEGEELKNVVVGLVDHFNTYQCTQVIEALTSALNTNLANKEYPLACVKWLFWATTEGSEGTRKILARSINELLSGLTTALQLATQLNYEVMAPILEVLARIIAAQEYQLKPNHVELILTSMSLIPARSISALSSQLCDITSNLMHQHTSHLSHHLPQLNAILLKLAHYPIPFLRTMQALPDTKALPAQAQHLPYLILSLIKLDVKGLDHAFYAMFDALRPNDSEQLLTWMNQEQQYRFKKVHADWTKFFKFKGKV